MHRKRGAMMVQQQQSCQQVDSAADETMSVSNMISPIFYGKEPGNGASAFASSKFMAAAL